MTNLQIILSSMPTLLTYGITFALTIACTFGAEWQLKHAEGFTPMRIKNKYLLAIARPNRTALIVFSALAILIPTVLAGLRAETVGGDVLEYATTAFDAALEAESFPYFNATYFHAGRSLEFGYMLMVWLCSRISSQVQMLLFATHLLVVGFFYAAFYAYRKYLSMWMAMSAFLCLFYCTSYNLMRQAIAMAIIMYATIYLVRKKYILYIAFVCLAALFHTSALMMLGLLVAWLIFGADIKKWALFAVAALVVVVLVFWQDMITCIIVLPLPLVKYANYLNGAVGFEPYLFLRHTPYLLFEIFAFKKTQEKNKIYSFFFLFAMLLTLGCYLTTTATYAYRVIEYFTIFRIFTLSMIFEAEDRPRWKFAYWAFIYARIGIFFLKHYCLVTSHLAFPYVPFWQYTA